MDIIKECLPLDIVRKAVHNFSQAIVNRSVLLSQDASAEALDQLDKDNERDKIDLMSTIDVEKKEAEQQVTRQYMSHYIVGLKVYRLNHQATIIYCVGV